MQDANFNFDETYDAEIAPLVTQLYNLANQWQVPTTLMILHGSDEKCWHASSMFAGVEPDQRGRVIPRTMALRAILEGKDRAALNIMSPSFEMPWPEIFYDESEKWAKDKSIEDVVKLIQTKCDEYDLPMVCEIIYKNAETTFSGAFWSHIPEDTGRMSNNFLMGTLCASKYEDWEEFVIPWYLGQDLRDLIS